MSGRNKSTRWRAWRRWLTTAGLSLAASASVLAAEPRAELLLPIATQPYVPRASSETPPPVDTPKPVQSKQRDPNFKYPPTYSEAKRASDFPELSGLWNRITKLFGSEEKKATVAQKPLVSGADKPQTNPPAATVPTQKPVVVPPPTRPPEVLAPTPKPTVAPTPSPTWRWYGYGAPNPGRSPLGSYGAVQPQWLEQTGATPGAFPKPIETEQGPKLPHLPATKEPTNTPPVVPLPMEEAKPDLILPPDTPTPATPARPAELQLPTTRPGNTAKVPSGDATFTPILPLTSNKTESLSRAQAPEAAIFPPAILAGLKKVCTGKASHIDLTPRGPGKIHLRLTLLPGVKADRLADALTSCSELNGFEIEMEFARSSEQIK